MEKDEPVYGPPDGAVLMSDHNVAGDAFAAVAHASLALKRPDEVLYYCGGYRVQPSSRLIIHYHLQGQFTSICNTTPCMPLRTSTKMCTSYANVAQGLID